MQPSSYKTRLGKRLCDPTGWFWSEKLDGVKGRWIDGKFSTRSGKELEPPEWFIKLLPESVNIEGELYLGLNTFHKTASLRGQNSRSKSYAWENVIFYVFDIIDYKKTWEKRQKKLQKMAENWGEHLQLVRWQEIKSPEHLEKKYSKIVEKGGEGVIIANPKGLYEDGHVEQILKYKAQKDCEAIIIGYRSDDSEKRLSSFIVHPLNEHTKKPNKKITFNIGTGLKIKDRFKYKEKFPIDSIVSYTYEIMGKNGKPRTPIIKGIRIDM